MKALSFWKNKNYIKFLLSYVGLIWYYTTLLRKYLIKYRSKNCFVICVGNINIGGAGKTPTVLSLYDNIQKYIEKKNISSKIVIVCKPYKANISEPTFVYSYHTPSEVGDEAFMMSKYFPTVIAKNPKKALQFLEDKKVDIVIMDDGLQNSSFIKDYNILVIDGLVGFGNKLLIPAGPLKEPFAATTKRINAIVSYNNGFDNLLHQISKIPSNVYTVKGNVKVISDNDHNLNYLAFCSIANPIKFEHTLKTSNMNVKKLIKLPDHYIYKAQYIEDLIIEAKKSNLTLITTEKDYVRIPAQYHSQISVLKINTVFDDSETFTNVIMKMYNHNK